MNYTLQNLPNLTPAQKTKGAAKYIRDCRRRNKQLAAKQRKIIAALEAEQKEMNEFDCACAFMQLPVHERLAMRSAITETAATVGRMSHAMDQLEHSDIHFAAVASVFPPAKETK